MHFILFQKEQTMPGMSLVYQPRKQQNSQLYQCVEGNFETLEQVYGEPLPSSMLFPVLLEI